MKNYTITVNGTVYEVTVEENAQGAASVQAPAPAAQPKASAPAAKALVQILHLPAAPGTPLQLRRKQQFIRRHVQPIAELLQGIYREVGVPPDNISKMPGAQAAKFGSAFVGQPFLPANTKYRPG